MIFIAIPVLVVLQCSDLLHRRLPNHLVAIYAALCPLALVTMGAGPTVWLQHGVVAVIGFLILLTFFSMGVMGGGDVKLGTAVLGWAGLQSLLSCLFVIGSVGLILAVLGLIADKLVVVGCSTGTGSVSRIWRRLLYFVSAKRGVPYGVALAAGGMVALPVWW